MTAQQQVLTSRVRKAWADASEETRVELRPLIDKAHAFLMAHLTTGTDGGMDLDFPDELLYVKSILDENNEGLAETTFALSDAIHDHVTAGGGIVGTGAYKLADPGWLEAVVVYHHYKDNHSPWPAGAPNVITIADDVVIAIAGDWGTGNFAPENSPSIKVGNAITALSPNYTIHLGDVYYAGTYSQEQENLVSIWPAGASGSFTLNSNHEMYDGAYSYFNVALAANLFSAQSGVSYFALVNSNWIIVALDSAYFDTSSYYMNGSIGTAANPDQITFLRQQATNAQAQGKKVIVLTHHNGLIDQTNGTQTQNTLIWNQITGAFPSGTAPAYWYWGHVHTGTVYAPQRVNGVTMLCRCTGHGSIPWGYASELQTALNNQSVEWFESTNAGDSSDPVRVFNGFVTLTLNGAAITEKFYDENGNVAWTGRG